MKPGISSRLSRVLFNRATTETQKSQSHGGGAPALDALEVVRKASKNRVKKFPDRKDPRFSDGALFPKIEPGFTLGTPAKVFTIGSCFARNIEIAMADYDIELPTKSFSVPESEWQFRQNGLLNEYNPGRLSQRIISALDGEPAPESTIIETKEGWVDLLLPGKLPVSRERAVARRAEIDAVYAHLAGSDLVIVTLGYVEAWLDNESGMFLNQLPALSEIKKQPGRFLFKRLGVEETGELLERATERLVEAGVEKILFTVSPVPLGTTFTGDDVVVANAYSKSVLRVCAEGLKDKYPEVDYFPSFEIASSGGVVNSFNQDNKHVKNELVEKITRYMISAYLPEAEVRPDAGSRPSFSEMPEGPEGPEDLPETEKV